MAIIAFEYLLLIVVYSGIHLLLVPVCNTTTLQHYNTTRLDTLRVALSRRRKLRLQESGRFWDLVFAGLGRGHSCENPASVPLYMILSFRAVYVL